MVINNEFVLGEAVYLTTDEDQLPRIVTAIEVDASGGLNYGLSCGEKNTRHYECEISREKNILVAA